MGCRTEKFGAAALLFTFLIETTNRQILKNVPKTVFCVWVIKTNLKYIDISGGSWYDKNRNKSAISRKGDGYENAGLIKAGWKDKFDNDSSPYTSTIVFLVKPFC